MKKYLIFLITIIVLSLSIGLPKASPPLEEVTVAQFGKARFLLYLPLYTAMEEGLFAKHGLDVELQFAGNDDQIFAAVASGRADFGMGDPIFTAIAQEKGFPAKTIAMMITSLGIAGYTDNPDVPMIAKPEDLAGLHVGSFPEPSTTYTLLSEFQRNHPNAPIVEAPFGAQLGLIEADRADIAIDLEPTVSVVEDQGYRVVFEMPPFTDRQVITGIMATQDTIDERPELAQAMTNALQDAVDLLYSTEGKTIALRVARAIYPDLSETVLGNAIDRMMKHEIYPRSIVIDDALWQRSIKTRLDSGELTSPQETRQSVDNTFALQANAQ